MGALAVSFMVAQEESAPGWEPQYWAAKQRAGLADLGAYGRLRMTGADSLDLLHRISTQDLGGLLPGQGAGTVLTSEKGRVIDLLAVYRFADHLLLVTSPGAQATVCGWLEKYTIIEDSQTADVTSATGLLALFGPAAGLAAQRLTREPAGGLPWFYHLPGAIGDVPVVVMRVPPTAGVGFHLLFASREAQEAAKAALLREVRDLGLSEVGPEACEALRIEAGLPAYGTEMDERYNPLEAGLESFISFSKGCYIGQEVVARLDTYRKVQKRLMGVLLPAGPAPEAGAPLLDDDRDAGFVTSSAYSPALGRPVALAYVRARYADPGRHLRLRAGAGMADAELTKLSPFG